MKFVKLDDAFVQFVNVYVKHKTFDRVDDVFKDIDGIQEEYPSVWNHDLSDRTVGQVFLDQKNWAKAGVELLSKSKIREFDKNILIKERVMSSFAEFRRLLLEYPIRLLYSPEGESEVYKMSNTIFGNRDMVLEIIENKFASCADEVLRVDLEEFETAIKMYFSQETEESLSEEEILKADKVAFCSHALFGLFKYKEILKKFPDTADYGDDGQVLKHIKQEFDILPYQINRFILPSLRNLKKR